MTIQDFLPKYIKRIIADRARQTVTAEYWNELFNLLVNQGDWSQEALVIVMDKLANDILFKSNAEEWEATEDYQPVTKKYVDDTTVPISGAVTVDGVKTFTSNPIVPTPVALGQVVNKAYVDSLVVSVGMGDAQLFNGYPSTYFATALDAEEIRDDIVDITNTIANLSTAAEDITIADVESNFTATDVEGALSELFQSASDGKSDIATAVTAKGIAASNSDTFPTLANKISQIVTVTEIADATAASSDILSGKIAYNNSGKVTGTIPIKTATVIVPNTTNQIITAGQYLSGAVTISGEPLLVPENIRSGIKLYGTTGTYNPTFKTTVETKDVGMYNSNKNGLQGTRTYTFSGPIKNISSSKTSGGEYCLIQSVDGANVTVAFYNTYFNDGTWNDATLTANIYYIG